MKILFVLFWGFMISILPMNAQDGGSGKSSKGGKGMNFVVDPAMSILYTRWKYEDNRHKKKITQNQGTITSLQNTINEWLVDVKKIEQRNVDYLKEKQDYAVDIEEIEYIMGLLRNIAQYQTKSAKMIKNNPSLFNITARMQSQIVVRGQRIISAVDEFAKKDGKSNMLNNSERNQVIISIIMEMREMRNISQTIYETLETADKYCLSNIDIRNIQSGGN